MRKCFIVFSFALVFAGCSSQPTAPAAAPAGDGAQNSQSSPEATSKDSDVLSNAKKCPKHSKLVDGKCTLQVESDD